MWRYYAAAVGIFAIIFLAASWISGSRIRQIDQTAYAAADTAPELRGKAADWINTDGKALGLYGDGGLLQSDPYAPGKKPVVLVDFWEYTCVNCLRTLPYVEDWAARYRESGLIVVGIHTPEFKFGHDKANVAAAVKRLGITYPVLVDSAYLNWNNFNNQFWPMKYVIDSRGKIVYTHPGEGGYEDTEQRLRDLLVAANPGEALPAPYGNHEATVKSAQPVYDMTGELYAGYAKARLLNAEGFQARSAALFAPVPPVQWVDGKLVVGGVWRFEDEFLQHARVDASDFVGVRYHARDAVAVIKPEAAEPFRVFVTLDGAPVPREDAGADLRYAPDGRSFLFVDAPREYQIVHGRIFAPHLLALLPGGDKFRLYSFDFAAT